MYRVKETTNPTEVKPKTGDTRQQLSNLMLHSPKAKYYVRINFNRAIKGIGSSSTYSGDSIEGLRSLAREVLSAAGAEKAQCHIYENKATYPSFDWAHVESFEISK